MRTRVSWKREAVFRLWLSIKQNMIRFFRTTGLIGKIDQLRFFAQWARVQRRRVRFRHANPAFPLPPLTVAYDAFGSLDPFNYKEQGLKHASVIAELILNNSPSPHRICDWGCGPVRVLRHMPDLFPLRTEFLGLDFNANTIAWCRANFPGIEFRQNNLNPPLPLESNSIDALYCISVFTHLSEEMHYAYAEEVQRVLHPGGILILTTHGNSYRNRLLKDEARRYDAGELVCRAGIQEGKRLFASFQSPRFVRQRLLQKFDILEHSDNKLGYIGFHQDVWVARRKSISPST